MPITPRNLSLLCRALADGGLSMYTQDLARRWLNLQGLDTRHVGGSGGGWLHREMQQQLQEWLHAAIENTAVTLDDPSACGAGAGGLSHREQRELGAFLSQPLIVTWESYLSSFVAAGELLLWYRLRETVGVNAVNSGSLGAAFDATIAGCTLGQQGQLGPNEAFSWDMVDDVIVVPAGAAHANLTEWTIAALVHPDSIGEGTLGAWWYYTINHMMYFPAVNRLEIRRDAAVQRARTVTSTGVTLGGWNLVFVTYEDTVNRQIRVFRGQAGVATEYAYNTQDAANGALTDSSGLNISLGNQTGTLAWTWDDRMDEAMLLFNRELTQAEMNRMTELAEL